jgi:hypothetical protein
MLFQNFLAIGFSTLLQVQAQNIFHPSPAKSLNDFTYSITTKQKKCFSDASLFADLFLLAYFWRHEMTKKILALAAVLLSTQSFAAWDCECVEYNEYGGCARWICEEIPTNPGPESALTPVDILEAFSKVHLEAKRFTSSTNKSGKIEFNVVE